MSTRFLNNNSSNNTDVVAKTFASNPLIEWVRNPSWPPCEANSGDNRVRGLYIVSPNNGNFIAMTISGAYTVNYGDGTTTNYASGVTAYYEFNYSSASLIGTEAPVTFTDATDLVTRTAHGYSNDMQVQFFNITTTTGIVNAQFYYVINATANTFQISNVVGGSALPLTNDGTGQLLPYRIATVTITPQAANILANVNLFVKHNQVGLQAYSTGWLDLAMASPNIATLVISGSSGTINHTNLQQVQINQLGNVTSFGDLFRNMKGLKVVKILSSNTFVTNTSNMFRFCSSLESINTFNTSNVTTMLLMFSDCYNLKTTPLLNTSSVTNMSGMFQNCVTLQTVPLFNTASVTDMSSMFISCSALTTVPLFNTVSVTNLSNMFTACSSLVSVPLFNAPAALDINSMFSSCISLVSVPLFNIVSVTNMGYMFQGCGSLVSVPLFNTTSVTNMQFMFSSCSSLKTVPLFNTTNVINMTSMFSACYSLENVPLFNTANVTNMASMFNSCSNIVSVPLFNTVKVTSTATMFNNCPTLQVVPLFNTSIATTMANMFNSCISLLEVPALVTTAVTASGGFSGMFSTCPSLSRIEAKNFRFTFSVTACKLSGTALDEIYTNLPVAVGQTITVTNNYGTTTDTPLIATAKGWTVTG